MRKMLQLFIICFFSNSLFGQVIFDPDSVNPNSLPSTMTVVDVNGQNYLQVALTGWDNYLQISSTTVENGIDAICCPLYLYSGKQIIDTVDTYLIVNVVSRSVIDTSTIATVCGNQIPEGFLQYAEIVFPEKEITHLQFASRTPNTWEVKTTDTILVGKVEAYKMDESVIFDPASFNADDLPSGMEIVTIDTSRYLKLTPHQYDVTLPVTPYASKIGDQVYGEFKYIKEDTSVNDSYRTSVVFEYNFDIKYNASDDLETDNFVDFSCTAGKNVINGMRFYVQNTDSWTALDYGEFYIGKIYTEEYYSSGESYYPAVPCDIQIDYSSNQVVIDGEKDSAFTQDYSIKYLALGQINELPAGPMIYVAPNNESYGKLSATWDTSNVYLFIETTGSSQQYIELYLQNRGYVYSIPQLSDVVSFVLKPGQNSPAYSGNGMPEYYGNNDSTNIPFVITETDTGFVYEVAIPWPTILKLDSTSDYNYDQYWESDIYTPVLGIDVMIHDSINGQETILSWANNKGFYGFEKDRADFIGQFTFSGEPDFDNISEHLSTTLKLFPNPATHSAIISSTQNITAVHIYNLSGQQVYLSNYKNQSSVQLNLNDLDTGVYIVHVIIYNEPCQILKLVKL